MAWVARHICPADPFNIVPAPALLPSELNALLTKCVAHLNEDGACVANLDLEHWPRHARPPLTLHIVHPGPDALQSFLQLCMRDEHSPRLMRAVKELQLKVSCGLHVPCEGLHLLGQCSNMTAH